MQKHHVLFLIIVIAIKKGRMFIFVTRRGAVRNTCLNLGEISQFNNNKDSSGEILVFHLGFSPLPLSAHRLSMQIQHKFFDVKRQ